MGRIACAFWNVHNLYPYLADKEPTKAQDYWPPTQEAYEQKIAAVASVLRTMPGGVPDLIAFCEVACPKKVKGIDVVAALQSALPGARDHYTGTEGDSRGITCAVMWNTDRLSRSAAQPKLHSVDSARSGGEYGRPILDISLTEVESSRQFTLLVNHWTSRQQANTEGRRKLGGQKLVDLVQSKVCRGGQFQGDPRALVVVVGDFNDEPFDQSLVDPEGAAGRPPIVRDRTAVLRRRPAAYAPVLYNAAWRLLGERQSRGEEITSQREMPAGTYLLGEVRKAQWRTFDQVLVSGGVLQGDHPVFDDGNLAVHCPPELVGPDGEPRMASDHFPVRFTLDL